MMGAERRLGPAWVALAAVALASLGFAEVRRRGALPGLVTHGFNPLVMRLRLAGGQRSPWGIVEHVGRRSGTTYRTPISLLGGAADDHVFVRLTYGSDVHWVRNVMATGGCRIQLHETILELDEPTVVTASENIRIPRPARALLDLAGRTYLRLRVVSRRSTRASARSSPHGSDARWRPCTRAPLAPRRP